MELAASADGRTIYVGGDFNQVNSTSRNRIAALDAQTGELLPFNPGANGRVDAIAVNGNTIYFGGDFTTAGTGPTGIRADAARRRRRHQRRDPPVEPTRPTRSSSRWCTTREPGG